MVSLCQFYSSYRVAAPRVSGVCGESGSCTIPPVCVRLRAVSSDNALLSNFIMHTNSHGHGAEASINQTHSCQNSCYITTSYICLHFAVFCRHICGDFGATNHENCEKCRPICRETRAISLAISRDSEQAARVDETIQRERISVAKFPALRGQFAEAGRTL